MNSKYFFIFFPFIILIILFLTILNIFFQHQSLVLLSFDTEGVVSENEMNSLLFLLAEKNVTATFFVDGSFVLQHPQITSRISLEGHELACHSRTHKALPLLSWKEQNDELAFCQELSLQENISVQGFRAPFRLLTFYAQSQFSKYDLKYDASFVHPSIICLPFHEISARGFLFPFDDYILLYCLGVSDKLFIRIQTSSSHPVVSLSYHPHLIMDQPVLSLIIDIYKERGYCFLTYRAFIEGRQC